MKFSSKTPLKSRKRKPQKKRTSEEITTAKINLEIKSTYILERNFPIKLLRNLAGATASAKLVLVIFNQIFYSQRATSIHLSKRLWSHV